MKVALIKQTLDVFGPWSSVRWENTDPLRLFNIWPGKAVLWEMTCLLRADWYIIPQQLNTEYIYDAVLKHPGRAELIYKYTQNVVTLADIPFDEYDVVITFDPILKVPKSKAIFAYYVQEHWDPIYHKSLQAPIGHYDLFLAHMLDAMHNLKGIPQSVSFPYLRAPDVVRSVFHPEKKETVWVDWRTLTTLGMTELWSETAENAAKRLERILGMPVRYKGDFNKSPYGIAEPPLWGDAARYLEAMGKCKYYISVGRSSGAGQSLCDAASLGCICIGEEDKAYHRLICHPACLCKDMFDLPKKFREVTSSPELQEEILNWQDNALLEHFVNKPLRILQQACDMKKS